MLLALNDIDPLPKLGEKKKPLNFKPLTDDEIKAIRLLAFEKSSWYDIALGIKPEVRLIDGYDWDGDCMSSI